MENTKKLKKAKSFGAIYFFVLASGLFVMDLIYNTLGWMDGIALIMSLLPLVVNKRPVFLVYGILNSFLWLFLGVAFFMAHADAWHTGKLSSAWLYIGGYLFVALSFFAALLLVYVGLYDRSGASGKRQAA